MKGSRSKTFVACGLLTCVLATAESVFAIDGPSSQSSAETTPGANLYVKLQLANTIKVSKLKSGDVIAGKLSQDVYSGDRELFPAGSQVHLTVDKLERVRRVPNDHWPWGD